jgi:hypothetical protein
MVAEGLDLLRLLSSDKGILLSREVLVKPHLRPIDQYFLAPTMLWNWRQGTLPIA